MPVDNRIHMYTLAALTGSYKLEKYVKLGGDILMEATENEYDQDTLHTCMIVIKWYIG